MIRARIRSTSLAAGLAAQAEALARAAAERRFRAGRGDSWRWRKAGLLWPLFTRNR